MTENHHNLRVFCLCGQKMQVTQEMHGRPAKCVACHQKWFIPTENEIPDGTQVLHLKEHPELLRLPGQFSRCNEGEVKVDRNKEVVDFFKPTPPPITDIDLGMYLGEKKQQEAKQLKSADPEDVLLPSSKLKNDESSISNAPDVIIKKITNTPLESFEPLRLLYSYYDELNRRRASLAENAEGTVRESLDGYEAALQRIQNRINEFLKREHASASRQLDVLEDEIARLNIALRVGECSVDVFLSQTDDLRKSRETLVRQIHNLSAWQDVKDSFMAGGASSVSLESFDESDFALSIPASCVVDADKPLYVLYGEELRGLFEMRAALERRKAEWQHMVAENDYAAVVVQEGLVETEAVLARNMAGIRFCHQRMEQIVNDCDADIKALSKYKEDVLSRAAKKQIPENNTQEILSTIESADIALVRMRALARQALSANSPVEVPMVSTTLIQRIKGTIGHHTFAVDSTLFVFSAACIILGLLMFTDPIGSRTDWLAVFCTCTAVGIAALGIIMDSRLRAPLVACFWSLLLILLMVFVYSRTSMDKYLILFPEDGSISLPLINIRAWLMVAGAALSGAGMAVAVANYRDFGKRFSTNVPMLIVFFSLFSGIAVAAMHTVAPRISALAIEEEAVSAYRITEDGNAENNVMQTAETTKFNNTLTPLGAHIPKERGELTAGDVTIQENASEIMNDNDLLSFGFLMQGVIHNEGSMPLFKASLTHPDGSVENISLKLGDVITGDWKAQEYNQYTKKLTISNGERLLVLEAGKQVVLAMAPKEDE